MPSVFLFPRFPMLHPTVRLIVWGAMAALVQWLPLLGLSLACAAALAAAAWLAPKRLGLLLHRTRWLIVSLVLLFALATPGVYLLPSLGSLSPTDEGLRLGFEHLMRLLFVLASILRGIFGSFRRSPLGGRRVYGNSGWGGGGWSSGGGGWSSGSGGSSSWGGGGGSFGGGGASGGWGDGGDSGGSSE